ncbi:HAMP domain-containing histidine kinase [Clostridium tagluense]|uniref:sensor histidine kinase n=1 Tax=Clostridium tagluense TaxID=360422 RepID=UPI001CF4C020|nr:HAMP domain-containing sensor histidine kinase [Clostridium tagluense]MCB2309522.1 HAMP domain-containing histidine kinase [Clostridium tagluense]MCB2314948.1 HAMP domain-containing histidine kinase [Clostridium tagluense]MCB2319797.1 HAMP domain-containing histidine kinase [Clostridium tagluense]MCB2324116.1 HAMP domain-containing histidine kinase [Clostridium tagluense]MCB2328967.1 HAMP domain-containing histidine kinase [Clostridium tagluense]
MMKKASLKVQIITTFILIIFLSVICTLGTVVTYVFVMFRGEKPIIAQANYYEQQIPNIEKFINSKGDNLLNYKSKISLEKITPVSGIKYQVIDIKGNAVYGTLQGKLIKDKKALINSINSINEYEDYKKTGFSIFGASKIKFIPIMDNEGNLKGTVALQYDIKPSIANKKHETLVLAFQTFLMFSPFIFIIFFTLVLTRKLIYTIQTPIAEIIAASNKIKEKDLDFDIIYKSNNELGKLAASFQDMKNALKEALHKQWIMEEDRKEMIKAIAHDLKTPIAIIQGHVEVLLCGNNSNPIRLEKYLNTIKSNTERMGKLISDMNTAAEIERQDFDLNGVKLNIIEFLENKADDYVILSNCKNVEFKLCIKDERIITTEVFIDIQRVEQILDNIISNALRYTPEGKSIKMIVKITSTIMSFTIEDEGEGFEEKDLPYVFQKFYKGDASRSREKGHTGLGMFIVKTLVEKHNGWIVAENRKRGGARIKFVIKEIHTPAFVIKS